jgi:hypothetical protein
VVVGALEGGGEVAGVVVEGAVDGEDAEPGVMVVTELLDVDATSELVLIELVDGPEVVGAMTMVVVVAGFAECSSAQPTVSNERPASSDQQRAIFMCQSSDCGRSRTRARSSVPATSRP